VPPRAFGTRSEPSSRIAWPAPYAAALLREGARETGSVGADRARLQGAFGCRAPGLSRWAAVAPTGSVTASTVVATGPQTPPTELRAQDGQTAVGPCRRHRGTLRSSPRPVSGGVSPEGALNEASPSACPNDLAVECPASLLPRCARGFARSRPKPAKLPGQSGRGRSDVSWVETHGLIIIILVQRGAPLRAVRGHGAAVPVCATLTTVMPPGGMFGRDFGSEEVQRAFTMPTKRKSPHPSRILIHNGVTPIRAGRCRPEFESVACSLRGSVARIALPRRSLSSTPRAKNRSAGQYGARVGSTRLASDGSGRDARGIPGDRAVNVTLISSGMIQSQC